MAILFFPTVPRFKKTPVQSDPNSDSPLFVVTGQPFQGHSLGGHKAYLPLENRILTLFQKKPFLSQQPIGLTEPVACVLFDDLDNTQRTSGKTDYRAIAYWHNGIPSANYSSVTVGLDQPSAATLSVWKPTKNSDGTIDEVEDELTAPSGAVWSNPTRSSPLSLGGLNRGQHEFLWIRRTVAAGATATPYDAAVIEFKATDTAGNVSSFLLIPFWTLKNSAYSLEVSEAYGRPVSPCGIKGADYNLTVKDSSGTKTDPPGNLLLISVVGPPHREPEYVGSHVLVRSGVFQAKAARLSAGTYLFPFRPPIPGHYLLHFDVGGVFSVTRGVEVSPME